MRWMNLEPIIHSEVSQKEKGKYLMYSKANIWNIKNGTDEFICRVAVKTFT